MSHLLLSADGFLLPLIQRVDFKGEQLSSVAYLTQRLCRYEHA